MKIQFCCGPVDLVFLLLSLEGNAASSPTKKININLLVRDDKVFLFHSFFSFLFKRNYILLNKSTYL